MIERVPILAILLTLLNIGGIVFNILYISKLILRNYKEFPFYISLIIFLLSTILLIFGISFTFYNSPVFVKKQATYIVSSICESIEKLMSI